MLNASDNEARAIPDISAACTLPRFFFFSFYVLNKKHSWTGACSEHAETLLVSIATPLSSTWHQINYSGLKRGETYARSIRLNPLHVCLLKGKLYTTCIVVSPPIYNLYVMLLQCIQPHLRASPSPSCSV